MTAAGADEGSAKRRILFAIDESEICKRSFKWYTDYIMLPSDVIIFVHVMEPDFKSSDTPGGSAAKPRMSAGSSHEAFDGVMKKGKDLGLSYITMAKNVGLESTAFLHLDTRPGRAILTSAKNHNVDMIVMGSGGLGLVKRVFLGTVSDYVVHNSTIPVVIVHTENQS